MSNRANTNGQFKRGFVRVAGMFAVASLAAWAASPAASPVPGSGAASLARARLAWNQGLLPLSFEANHGQVDSSVQYHAQGPGFGIYFTKEGAVLALHKPASLGSSAPKGNSRLEVRGVGLPAAGSDGPRDARRNPPPALTTDIIRMELVGADSKTQPTGLEPLPGTSNYILGNDPAKWHTRIPNFSRVKYKSVYHGVDLLFYGNRSQLEYDFIVAPHADADSIRLRFAGASSLALDPEGNLAIHAPDGTVSFRKPVIYQQTGEQQTRGARDTRRPQTRCGIVQAFRPHHNRLHSWRV